MRAIRALAAVMLIAVGALASAPSALTATINTSFTGTVSATGTKYRTHTISVVAPGTISITLDWDTTSANLTLFLTDPTNTQVAAVTNTSKPKTISFSATMSGTYKIGVKAPTGTANYTVQASYPGADSTGSGLVTFQKAIGFSGPAGLYAYGMDWDPTDNTILVGDYWNYRVWRYDTSGNLIGLVSQHALGGVAGGITAPYDVEADPTDTDANGNAALWVADQGSSRFVEFSHSGKWLQTIGKANPGEATGTDAKHPGASYAQGCGAGAEQIPTHIVVDTVFDTHYIYVSDPRCRNVYIFDHQGGFHGQLDWTGSGVGTPIPRGVAEDAQGYIYVAEYSSRRIFVFDPSTKKIIGSIGPQSDENDVRGLDIDQTNHLIYTVGAYWNRVYEFSFDPAKVAAGTGASSIVGKFVNEWRNMDGSNGNGPQPLDSVRFPAVDGQGNVYVGETWGCDAWCTGSAYGYGVEKYTPGDISAKPSCTVTTAPMAQSTCAGATRAAWAMGPQPPPRGGFNQQNGIAINPSDNSLFVVDTFEQRVQKFDTTSTCTSSGSCPAWLLQWGSRQPASPASDGFGYPRALTFGDDGRVWVGDNNNAVIAFNPDGSFVHRYGSQGPSPGMFKGGVQGVHVENGKVYATDVAGCRLQVFDEAKLLTASSIATAPAGTLLENLGTCGTGVNQMTAPRGVAVSPDGNTVYVAETGTSRISVWNLATNSATTAKPVCGGKGLAQPWGITWDPSKTWLYIGDVKNVRVVRWNPATNACQVVVTPADVPPSVGFLGANFVEFDSNGLMYVSDNARHVDVFQVTG
ncbi:MAG TPA: SMP-30/gluconolactonase/LRE family protein [Gaiellales bacterium]|nr:SMP-30/gluconolactonase/LRE family protein [Gaiellales bacterium]